VTDVAARPSPQHPRITANEPPPGFSPGIGRYVAQLAETRRALLGNVEGLTPEQLSWHPNDGTESIGTHLLHVAAIEWSWVFEEIFRRSDDDYDGWEEALPLRLGLPQVRDQPLAYYTDRLERVRAEVIEALRGLTDDDLPRLVADASPPPDEEPGSSLYTIDWILFHLVHHEAHHAGQVELLVRLLPGA
jgi:uncharacterized damage-inducible protein DinB